MWDSRVEDLKVAIAGPGALGSLLGAMLYESGIAKIQYFGRQGPRAHRFCLEGFQERSSTYAFANPETQSFDLLLVVVKCYDVVTAIEHFFQHNKLHQNGGILIVSNGMMDEIVSGHAAQIKQSLALATSTFAVKPLSPSVYAAVNPKGWLVSGLDSCMLHAHQCSKVFDALFNHLARFNWQWRTDSRLLRQKKWLMNTSLNSICGLHKLPRNGDALLFKKEMRCIFDEAFDLASRLWGGFANEKHALWQELLALTGQTADNENSMVQDIRMGRKTESDFFAGLYRLDKERQYPKLRLVSERLAAVNH